MAEEMFVYKFEATFGGGTYRTDTDNLDCAWNELKAIYQDTLQKVIKHSTGEARTNN